MSLGSNISKYRKEAGMTQEALAQKLNVTNQAVSKWETDQCCPDTMLLPKIADILRTSIDGLFGRELIIGFEDKEHFRLLSYDGETKLTNDYCGNDMVFSYSGAGINFEELLKAVCEMKDRKEK
ncbi:MAG: helix-turn-helix domain-containing protein [Oscillospiraceae bacterium]|nr:helix-turn-helix domain-containing protein [Oscillospiraceae bacterium]